MPDASEVVIRVARAADYDAIAGVVDAWWGREILPVLPRLFLDHFHRTSLVAKVDGRMVGFLIGFPSPSEAEEAYIHFVGVHPQWRRSGLACELYERFFATARAYERRVVTAITAPTNETSIAFHRRMGFTVDGPVADYNGPGRHLMTFRRAI
ncbi:GNAT family N-acetyltransferase [Nocardia tenerifensis]|uniref:GNAT family N-acetyltransferase n=1 Tax=Nocardia tenerifensis TaxID=228006 RepID=UPI001FECC3C2|nr:GNAT family N-acetyltransferase [Nocardia tenerifensis]